MANPVLKNLYEAPKKVREIVSDVMNPDPHTVKETKTLYEATEKMLQYDCGFLVVVNEQGKPTGAITDRDIVIYGIAKGKDPKLHNVEDVMNRNLFTCYEGETLELAADHMSENGVRRLAVLNVEDDLCGVVSIADMLKHVEDDSINVEVIRHLFKYA